MSTAPYLISLMALRNRASRSAARSRRRRRAAAWSALISGSGRGGSGWSGAYPMSNDLHGAPHPDQGCTAPLGMRDGLYIICLSVDLLCSSTNQLAVAS